MKKPLLDASPDELQAWMAERGHRSFHARQVYRWIFERAPRTSRGCRIFPKGFGDELEEEWTVFASKIVFQHVSPDGTEKLLLAVPPTAGGSNAC